jgi:hypothetical protein
MTPPVTHLIITTVNDNNMAEVRTFDIGSWRNVQILLWLCFGRIKKKRNSWRVKIYLVLSLVGMSNGTAGSEYMKFDTGTSHKHMCKT